VELVIFCSKEDSWKMYDELLKNTEGILTDLGISEAAYISTSYKLDQAFTVKNFDIRQYYQELRKTMHPLPAFDQLLEAMRQVDRIDSNDPRVIRAGHQRSNQGR
jgi:hypothetical protein